MTDKYFIIEYTDAVETWRSEPYTERRKAEYFGKLKQKANPDKKYRIELVQPDKAYKY